MMGMGMGLLGRELFKPQPGYYSLPESMFDLGAGRWVEPLGDAAIPTAGGYINEAALAAAAPELTLTPAAGGLINSSALSAGLFGDLLGGGALGVGGGLLNAGLLGGGSIGFAGGLPIWSGAGSFPWWAVGAL